MFVKLAIFFSTGFGVGTIPELLPQSLRHSRWADRWTGSGFLGTVLAFFLAYVCPLTGVLGAIFLVLISLLAVYLSGVAEQALGNKDDHRIVIDEVAGYFFAVAFIPGISLPLRIAGFVLFRIFDVFKIPSRKVQNLPGGWGVMMDDILAGIAANLLLHAYLKFS